MKRPLVAFLGTLTLALTSFASMSDVASAASACPPPPVASQSFASFGDGESYVLANDGTFDPIGHGSLNSPWTLSGGASIVADNDPWNLGHGVTNSALSLPAGSSATSGCTTAPMITSIVRFFIRNTGDPNGQLHVQILVNGGKNGTLDGGTITAGNGWTSSNSILLPWANPLKGAVQLQVVLTPVGTNASFEVDDVFIDPFLSR
jgi:hypothetical protein